MDPSMRLKDIECRLPPGFRFHPSDEELVCFYLRTKVVASQSSQLIISPPATTMVEVDVHTREPWELPEAALLSDNEWYFFSFRDRKYATGLRTNRATKHGYWKATCKDKVIHQAPAAAGTLGMVIGVRKTLVFYFGRAPNGRKSGWVMHEFRLATSPSTPPEEDWVLCRVFHKGKGEDDQGGSCNGIVTCSSNNSTGPGSWPTALCSSPPLQLQHPDGAAAAADRNNLESQLLPISSSPIINDQLQLLDDDQLIMRQDATLDSAMLLQDSCFEFTSDLTQISSRSTGKMNSGYGGNCTRGMEMALLLGGDGCYDGVRF